MPPPALRLKAVLTYPGEVEVFPSFQALCEDRDTVSLPAGEYELVDCGRNCEGRHDHNAGDGYYYRHSKDGRPVGWLWQAWLPYYATPEEKRDLEWSPMFATFNCGKKRFAAGQVVWLDRPSRVREQLCGPDVEAPAGEYRFLDVGSGRRSDRGYRAGRGRAHLAASSRRFRQGVLGMRTVHPGVVALRRGTPVCSLTAPQA